VIPDVTPAMVEEAWALLGAELPPTPTFPSPGLSETVGVEVWVKFEVFQPIRTFKVRGAWTRLRRAVAEGDRRPVVTASAGNHGLAVAYAARRQGRPATVYVPVGANAAKVAAIRAEGATVVAVGRDYQEAAAAACRERPDDLFVHAFDDPWVIAGQGTTALELVRQADVDTVFVAVGGGGLIGGMALWLKSHRPDVRVVGVEMRGADAMARSLAQGRVVELPGVATIADGLAPRAVSERTRILAERYVDELLLIDDDALWPAMDLYLTKERVLAEPSGAASLAGLLARPDLVRRRAAVVLSGGNVPPDLVAELLRRRR
jgi:threonine dehydratase